MLKHIILSVLTLRSLTGMAQTSTLHPITRFHASDSPYTVYRNNFLSGFMQVPSAATAKDSLNGFLQMPILGRPVWVYVGEKDSTQFMAYASGYKQMEQTADSIGVTLTRYGIRAKLEQRNGVWIQHYAFPDTTAEKCFLIDVDHVLGGVANEDMDIKMVDRKNIRAYKRGYEANTPQMYYFAHFSHPYESYNIRRERVTLEDGSKESRLKAVFSFLLKKDEELVVTSGVSDASADAAYAMVEGHKPAQGFKDVRKQRPQEEQPLLAESRPSLQQSQQTASVRTQQPRIAKKDHTTQQQTVRKTTGKQLLANGKSHAISDLIIVETREAPLRAAFYTALDHLLQLPTFKSTRNASDFMEKAFALSAQYAIAKPDDDDCKTDSTLRSFAAGCMSGESLKDDANGQRAASFMVESMGLCITDNHSVADGNVTFTIKRPLFNVVTVYYPNDRRFILHTKSNTPANCKVAQATWNGTRLTSPAFTISCQSILKGGVLTAKMGKPF